jgi:Phage integrase family
VRSPDPFGGGGLQYAAWCSQHQLRLFAARQADIERFARSPARQQGGHAAASPAHGPAIDLAISERIEGPIFQAEDGRRMDRHGAAQIVRRIARRAAIAKNVGPHALRHAFITAALDAGVPLRDVQETASHPDPRTTMRYDRARASLDRRATYRYARRSLCPSPTPTHAPSCAYWRGKAQSLARAANFTSDHRRGQNEAAPALPLAATQPACTGE